MWPVRMTRASPPRSRSLPKNAPLGLHPPARGRYTTVYLVAGFPYLPMLSFVLNCFLMASLPANAYIQVGLCPGPRPPRPPALATGALARCEAPECFVHSEARESRAEGMPAHWFATTPPLSLSPAGNPPPPPTAAAGGVFRGDAGVLRPVLSSRRELLRRGDGAAPGVREPWPQLTWFVAECLCCARPHPSTHARAHTSARARTHHTHTHTHTCTRPLAPPPQARAQGPPRGRPGGPRLGGPRGLRRQAAQRHVPPRELRRRQPPDGEGRPAARHRPHERRSGLPAAGDAAVNWRRRWRRRGAGASRAPPDGVACGPCCEPPRRTLRAGCAAPLLFIHATSTP